MGGGDGRESDVEVQSIVRRASSLEEAWMARCRAANEGIHIQHDAERRVAIGNDAPAGEGRLKP